MPKRSKKSQRPGAAHKENIIQRAAEEVEVRLIEGAEMATETTSAETNVALAALRAITGAGNEDKTTEEPSNGAEREAPGSQNR